MSKPARFELHDVSVLYDGHAALQRVGLTVPAGDVLAVVGPSGAGKTTLLRLLNASVRTSSGRLLVDGGEVGALSAGDLRRLRSRVGFIPQDFGLVPNLRVSQNVLAGRLGREGLVASLRSMLFPSRARLEELFLLLERLGIPEKIFQRVDSLSGGQQQRVAIARALYQEPGALLADEPLSSLDPERSRETLALLIEVARERGLTLVLSMHDIELARAHVPRLVGLRAGRVLFDGPPAQIAEQRYRDLYRLAEEGGRRRDRAP